MKKKLLVGLLAAAAAICGAFGLSACGEPDRGGNKGSGDEIIHEHNLTAVKENEATCAANGNVAYYTCSGCEKWFEDRYGENEITDKTSVVIEKKQHKLTLENGTEATCTSEGNKAYYACSGCGNWFWDEDGENRITNKTGVVIPKKHTLTLVKGKNATCTEDGNQRYYICSDCGNWFWDENGKNEIYYKTAVIIDKGHNYEKGFCQFCKQPQPATTGLKYTYTADGYEVAGIGSATGTEIIIPSTYNGRDVTSIGSMAFRESSAEFILIPESVTLIESSAFYMCGSLTDIVIPDSLTSLGYGVFDSCNKLKYNEYDNAKYLGNSNNPYLILAAAKNDEITSCVINDKTKFINSNAFNYCNKLTNVTFGNEVISIGYGAFGSCKLLKSIILPDNVTIIGASAFEDCIALTSINIPDSVLSIGDEAFSGCDALAGITIPDGVLSIGDKAFYGCNAITDLTVPDSVLSIGEYAFYYCRSLKTAILGSGLKSIGRYAFSDCRLITSITIPESVTSIGEWAFEDCKSIIIYCEAAERPEGWESFWNSTCTVIWNCKQNDKDSEGNAYTAVNGIRFSIKDGVAAVTEQPKNIITADIPSKITYNYNEYSVTSISPRAFYECSSLKSVSIADGITSIEYQAFRDCSSLESVTIGEGLTSIGENAFKGCSSLTSITIPESVTSISGYAFYNCSSLTSITLPKSVTSIGEWAFYDCSSLTSITLPESVTTISEYTFYKCSALNGITLPDGLTVISYSAFENCSSLTGITIPESVTSIGISAFENCSSLTSITIPDGITSIGADMFKDCSALQSIIIPESVTSIESSAFRGCSSLTSIAIPDGVTSIGDFAFEYCRSLTSIVIPEGVNSIGWYVFNGCSSLESIVIPDGVEKIGYEAFYRCSSLTSVTIPDSVTSIDNYVFCGCSMLIEINFKGTKAQWNDLKKGNNWDWDTGKYVVHCKDGDIAKKQY